MKWGTDTRRDQVRFGRPLFTRQEGDRFLPLDQLICCYYWDWINQETRNSRLNPELERTILITNHVDISRDMSVFQDSPRERIFLDRLKVQHQHQHVLLGPDGPCLQQIQSGSLSRSLCQYQIIDLSFGFIYPASRKLCHYVKNLRFNTSKVQVKLISFNEISGNLLYKSLYITANSLLGFTLTALVLHQFL